MELPGLTDIEAGNAILFLGAGFSSEATNNHDKPIKDKTALIEYLLSESGIRSTEGYDLETAAEEFIAKHNEYALAELLNANFRSKIIQQNQKIIVCQPWYRIYTTNYDDIVERVCGEEAKSYTTKEVSDPVSPPLVGITQLIHIYGNITRCSLPEFQKHFILTEKQKDNFRFIQTSWLRRLHDDILAAKAVFL
jgi:hypothetical protein